MARQDRSGFGLYGVTNGRISPGSCEEELDDGEFLDRVVLGIPDTSIRKFGNVNREGVNNISNWMMSGGIEHQNLMRYIKLIGEDVIPALK